ncbi:MAG TPA: hypothetical protein PLR08_03270 [bacterium]|nr:hypothetical protein [Candidatus Magasanikbacteria bacterium]HPF95542.1 hypothetical protein [bacterium]
MDGKHFSLITIAMVILLGIVGLGFMQMNTNNTLSTISNRLVVVEQQIKQEPVKTEKVTAAEEATTPCNGDCDAGVVEYKDYQWDFSLQYPEDYTVALVDDGFYSGQKNLRLTSKPGTLFLAGGGSAKPMAGEFVEGIQLDIRELGEGQIHFSGEETFVDTKNPLVKEFISACDGPGCDTTRIFYISTRKGSYVMDVNFSKGYPYTSDIDGIIASIKE